MLPRHIITVLAIALGLVHTAPAAAQTCLTPIEARAKRVLFDARFELERHRSLTDAFANFNELQRRWNRATWGTAAQRCLRAHPELLMAHQRLIHRGRPVLSEIARRRDKLCDSVGPVWLASMTDNIDAALADGNLLFARAQSNKLARLVTSGSFFPNCPTLRRRIARMRSDYLPHARAQMRIPGVAKKLARQRDALRPVLAAARLHGRRRVAALAKLLSTPAQRATVRERLSECDQTARVLRRIGAGDTTTIGDTQLAKVEHACDALATQLPLLVATTDAHQRAVAARRLRRWERLSIYGSRMWRVYKRHGKPSRQRHAHGAVIWVYELSRHPGRCLHIRFSNAGRILGRSTRACHQLASRATLRAHRR